MTCCVVPSMVSEYLFVDTVLLERAGWRFEARYTGFFATVQEYARLSYEGERVETSLPTDVELITPLGSFSWDNFGWSATRDHPPIWSSGYRLPPYKEGQPWVKTVEHELDTDEFLERRYYRAPAELVPGGIPWEDKQLEGTPTDWVYVYHLSWSYVLERHDDYSNHTVEGYWVDPARLKDLPWETIPADSTSQTTPDADCE